MRIDSTVSKYLRSRHRLERTEIRPAALHSGYSSRYQKVLWPMAFLTTIFLLKVERGD